MKLKNHYTIGEILFAILIATMFILLITAIFIDYSNTY